MNKSLFTVFSLVIILGLGFSVIAITTSRSVNTELLFKELPDKPNNYIVVRRDIQAGLTNYVCDVSEAYYLQPDFYPTWDRDKNAYYSGHDYKRWGVHGYGTYPAEVGSRVSNMRVGDTLTHCTFLRTSWGLETYQGLYLVPIENEYFDVKVDPSIFMLGRTFPVFEDDWVKKIVVTATAKKDIPAGRYELGFKVTAPPTDIESMFYRQVLEKNIELDTEYIKKCSTNPNVEDCELLYMLRQNKYVSGGQWQTGTRLFKLVIEVE